MAKHHFAWTLHDPSDEQIMKIKESVGKRGITYICFGRETCPTTGRPHLQGYLQSNQKEYARFKKQFDANELHIERALAASGPSETELLGEFSKPYTAIGYCMKDGDFWEAGTKIEFKEMKGQGHRTDLETVQSAVERGEDYQKICQDNFRTAAKYHRFIKEQVQMRDEAKNFASFKEEYASSTLLPWQKYIQDIVVDTPHKRNIYWIWESQGNMGKSWITNYLAALHGATIMTAGEKKRLTFIWINQLSRIAIFDLSRTNASSTTFDPTKHLNGIYSLAEDLKNGRVINTFQEPKTVFFKIPHVIFFTNFEPDYNKWSDDRYSVIHIETESDLADRAVEKAAREAVLANMEMTRGWAEAAAALAASGASAAAER